MPSTSPGNAAANPQTTFSQILPGAPNASLQAFTTFVYRHKRYIAYISGSQLSILSSPTKLVQAISFKETLVAVTSHPQNGKLVVAGRKEVTCLDPVTEGWTKIWWEQDLNLRREDASDDARMLDWGNEGEILVAGTRLLSLFSTLPSSRTASPILTVADNSDVEERRPLWSMPAASPISYATFSPSGGMIATCGTWDRLVKIWRRLSFEEGLFDHTYLPHAGTITHLQWKSMHEFVEERRGSGISGRREEDPEVLFTIASDGLLRIWKAGSMSDLDILLLQSTVDLVSAVPQSPSLTAKGSSKVARSHRYSLILPAEQFAAAITAAHSASKSVLNNGPVNHTLDHLKEVASESPDIIVALDGQGRMSAWGIQSIGHKRRPDAPGSSTAFHVSHTEGLPLRFSNNANARLCAWFDDGCLQLLAHDFSGNISWWQGDVESLFSPGAAGHEALTRLAFWSGHESQVTALDALHEDEALVTRDAHGHACEWTLQVDGLLVSGERLLNGIAPSSDASDSKRARGSPPRSSNISYAAEKEGSSSKTVTVSDEGILYFDISPAAHDRSIETGLSKPTLLAVNQEIAAVASAKEMVIVDLLEGYVEHRATIPDRSILHLSCYAVTPGHNLVAIGYANCVEVLAQARYVHRKGAHNWTSVKEIVLDSIGMKISNIQWLSGGRLVLAAGNGALISDSLISTDSLTSELKDQFEVGKANTSAVSLQSALTTLRRPLPPWHPHSLSQLVHHGKLNTALRTLHTLGEKLKFWSEGEDLHAHFGNSNATKLLSERDSSPLNDDDATGLLEQLGEKSLPAVTNAEQGRLKRIVHAVQYISQHKDGLDQYALRYLFQWKVYLLEAEWCDSHIDSHLPNGTFESSLPNTPYAPVMNWREVAFASHSTTQQPLLDILTLHYDNKVSWPIARNLGITAWLSDHEALTQVFEALGQSAYRSTSPPDPSNAALYFLALHKKQMLLGLWRIATWHKEQRATSNFLKRDFNQPDARTAAKKNAYALMGKRRFQYAAAFFLLADDVASATSLLAGQCEDVMLAIAVARLYSGDASAPLEKLIRDRLLPDAEKSRDRWLMSWCRSKLQDKHGAARALVQPLDGQRLWHQDDPILLMLYRDLRTGRHEEEYQAVLRGARILRRMGLWTLALDLVAEWQFQAPDSIPPASVPSAETNGVSHSEVAMLDVSSDSAPAGKQPLSMLDSFDTPPPADDQAARAAKAAELLAKLKLKKAGAVPSPAVTSEQKPKPESTQFKEPDANSLLDSFGF